MCWSRTRPSVEFRLLLYFQYPSIWPAAVNCPEWSKAEAKEKKNKKQEFWFRRIWFFFLLFFKFVDARRNERKKRRSEILFIWRGRYTMCKTHTRNEREKTAHTRNNYGDTMSQHVSHSQYFITLIGIGSINQTIIFDHWHLLSSYSSLSHCLPLALCSLVHSAPLPILWLFLLPSTSRGSVHFPCD